MINMTEPAKDETKKAEISNEEIKMAIDVWKTCVDVQQHFNLIEMQIRNIAITLLTATIGAAVLAYNQLLASITKSTTAAQPTTPTMPINILGLNFSPSSMIILAGLFAWGAFYFMDRFWYHRLLQGSVEQARQIEKSLKDVFPYLNLSNKIKSTSPFKLFNLGIEIHSEGKIDIFYGSLSLVLILLFFVFR